MSHRFWCGILLYFIFLVSPSVPAFSQALELDGALSQGGLVVGRVAPGAQVFLDNRAVQVAPDGLFALGFGRKAASKSLLTVRYPDGTKHTRALQIKTRRYKITRIDGLSARKVTPNPEDLKRIRAESQLIKQARRRATPDAYFRSRFIWPVAGRISGVFGSQRILNGKPRQPHSGVDIAAPRGTPVRAMADGIVILAHQDMFFTGKTLMIDHGHGLLSVYAHLSAIDVKDGALIKKGARIGRVGATGRATAPHLHWGVSWFATRLDPALIVGPMPMLPMPPDKK